MTAIEKFYPLGHIIFPANYGRRYCLEYIFKYLLPPVIRKKVEAELAAQLGIKIPMLQRYVYTRKGQLPNMDYQKRRMIQEYFGLASIEMVEPTLMQNAEQAA